jgi:hypothetical protein
LFEALVSGLDRDEARAPAAPEVPPHALAITSSIHRELETVKFLESFGAPDDAATEAWWENMAMCFALHNFTSNLKVCKAVVPDEFSFIEKASEDKQKVRGRVTGCALTRES